VNLQVRPTVERARVRLPSGSMPGFEMGLLWEFCLHFLGWAMLIRHHQGDDRGPVGCLIWNAPKSVSSKITCALWLRTFHVTLWNRKSCPMEQRCGPTCAWSHPLADRGVAWSSGPALAVGMWFDDDRTTGK